MSDKITFKLQQPLLGWSKGEEFILDERWREWTRKKTGETFDLKGSIGEGEKAMLLDLLAARHMTSILTPKKDGK